MRRLLSHFRLRNDDGAIAPLAAVTLAGLVGLAGLVTDVGVWYVQRSNLQSATDAAALGAANRPATASTVATTLLTSNGYGASNLVSATAGYYCPNASLAPAARFSTTPCATGNETPSSPNAVMLQAKTAGPALLTRVLGGSGANIQTTAIAARVDEAGLTIASGLATVDQPIVNAVLQSLVGGSGLSLSAVQFNGLISTDVVAKSFLDALAADTGVSSGTYGQLLAAPAKLSDVLQAEIDALNTQSAVTDVSAAVAGVQAIKSKLTGSVNINLGQLFDLGVWRDQPIGATAPSALGAGINVLQLATFALQLGGGQHAVTVPSSGLNIPGLLGVTVQATAIEPPQSAYFAFGPTGVSVHTAQVRVQLALQVAPPLIQAPLYIEVAHGDATISAIGCGTDPANDGWVKVQAKTGIASVYIGTPSANAMTNFTTPATVSPAPLLNVSVLGLGVLQIGAAAQLTAGSSTATTLTFTQTPSSGVPANSTLTTSGYLERIASTDGGPAASSGWPAQVVSTGILGGVGTGLWNSLSSASLKVCVLSVCNGTPNALTNALAAPILATLQPLLVSIDPLIDQILAGLGVQLGTTEVSVTGLRCGVPVLVG